MIFPLSNATIIPTLTRLIDNYNALDTLFLFDTRLYHKAVHVRFNFTPSHFTPSHTLIVLSLLNMATDKPLLLSAIIGSKNEIAIIPLFSTDGYLDIEVEGDIENGKWTARSQYYVRIYVAEKEVAKSTNSKPRSSVLKWEWNANNQM